MKRLYILFLSALIGVSVSSFAQQEAQYSQFMVNPFLVNPAFGAAEDFIDIKAGFRSQWAGWENSPQSMYVSGHSPIGKPHVKQTHKGDDRNYFGLGGLVYTDKSGPTSRTSAYLNFCYNLQITESTGYGYKRKDGIRLSLGSFIGFQQFSIDGSKLETPQNDPRIAEATQTSFEPDFSFGAILYFQDLFWVGASTSQMFSNQLDFSGIETLETDVPSRLSRHFFFSGGSKIEVDREVYILPALLVKKTNAAPFSVDVNTRLDYKDMYFGGLSYRHEDALSVMAGLVLDKTYEIAYSYDITLSEIGRYSNGSHEVILGIRLQPNFVERNPDDWFMKQGR